MDTASVVHAGEGHISDLGVDRPTARSPPYPDHRLQRPVTGQETYGLLRNAVRFHDESYNGGLFHFVGHGRRHWCRRHERGGDDDEHGGVDHTEGGATDSIECGESRQVLDRSVDHGSEDCCANSDANEQDDATNHTRRLWSDAGDTREQPSHRWRETERKEGAEHERADVDGLPDQSSNPAPDYEQHHENDDDKVDHDTTIRRGISGTRYESS